MDFGRKYFYLIGTAVNMMFLKLAADMKQVKIN